MMVSHQQKDKKNCQKEEKLSEIPRPFKPADYVRMPSLQWFEANHLAYLKLALMERVGKDFPHLMSLPLMDILSVGITQNFRSNVTMEDVFRAWYEDYRPASVDLETFIEDLKKLKTIFSSLINYTKDFRDKHNVNTHERYLPFDSFELHDTRFIRMERVNKISGEALKQFQDAMFTKVQEFPELKDLERSHLWDLVTVSVKETFGNKVTNSQFFKAYFLKLMEASEFFVESDLTEEKLVRLCDQLIAIKKCVHDLSDPRRYFPRH